MEMDLVDIDKVLDDLELNETSSNVSPLTSTAAIIPSSDTEKNNSKNTSTIINNSLEHNNIHDNICSNLLTDKNDETDHQHNNQQHYHHNNKHVFQNLNQNKDNIIKKYLDDSSSSTQNKNISMDDDRIKNKKFVTVSNVFSSLDDYRRDVESLQQPQQHQTKQFENDEQQQKNQEQNKYINMEESSLQQSSKKSEDIDNDNDSNYKVEFEKCHTDRQNKESWKHGKQHKHHQNQNEDDEYTEDEPDDIGQTTSSSSITTSSPSSFSSGPSPGSPSESCSYVLGQDNNKESVDEEDDIDYNRDNRETNEEMKVDKEQHNVEKELEQNSNEINEKQQQQLQKQQQQQQQRNDGNNKESSELGLSSISSYLYCENVSSSLPCSSQDIKLDALSSISSSQTTQNIDLKNNDNENLILNAEKKQKQLHGDNSIHKTYSAQKQQKVVGFGSTMDEISDTELDSILQEIDNDFQMYYVPPTAAIATTDDIPTSTSTNIDKSTSTVSKAFLSSSKSNILEQDDSIKECSTNNVEKTNIPFSNRSGSDELIEEDRITGKSGGSSSDGACGIEGFNNSQQYLQITPTVEDENNLQNADSFSQASTIEFAELRLQTDFDTDVNDEKSANAITTNSNTVSDQTVELATSSSILAGNDCVLKNTDEKNHIVLEHQQHENSPNNDVKVDKVAQGDNSATQHIQRPNSLDLPTQMDVKMYINSTAGQTPPASRLDDISLLSTSSSDDQHLSSSEQFGISSSGAYNQSSSNNNGNQSQQQDINSPVSLSHRHQLGKVPPFWIPDNEAPTCMRCKQKFSLIKRRHHCRACGKVLCSVCCSQKAKLPFIKNAEARVCIQCSIILNGRKENEIITDQQMPNTSDSTMNITSGNASILKSSEHSIDSAGAVAAATSVTTSANQSHRSPNPNNPMEYCSMISPYQQVGQQAPLSPISVMVPVGVLKREGAPKSSRKDKNVIFSDGIRPGCDLTELDNIWDTTNFNKKTSTSGNSKANINSISGGNKQHHKESKKHLSAKTIQFSYDLNETEEHFMPKEEYGLPPICISNKNEIEYKTVQNNAQLIERLKTEKLKFSIRKNLYVHVKIVKLKCCVNKTIINFTSEGLRLVGQDEIIILLELDNSDKLTKDIFVCVDELYKFCTLDVDYARRDLNFIHGSDENTGFLFIRPTFQCLQEIYLPEPPFLIGILINRSEVKWARGFPLRLMLRLGAEYRYYPCPHISIRERKSVYGEIAQTILNFLIDFGHYSYGLRTIKGMYIHMEDRKTNILIPKDSYDEVIKALNDSSDHILALGANFSKKADGHLVCIQNMEPGSSEIHTYSTQAINIQGQARKVTGASFIVFNGALKTTSGLTGKCNIVEDGLMVQILPAKMQAIRSALRNMRDYDIVCGPNDADESQTEIVSIKWTTNDTEVNIGVKSPIDGKIMDGIKSIRVQHNYYSNKNYSIHFLEIFVIQCDNNDEMSFEMSYEIANSAVVALASYLDLLAANGCHKIGLRVTLHRDNECYEAGSNYTKLPPLYMNALDNELVPVLQKQSIQSPLILELIFCIVNK